jgi:hypothetical protein
MAWLDIRSDEFGFGDAWATAGDLLATALPRRWAHSQGVCCRARAVGPHVVEDDNEVLLAQAAILHDVGYSPSIALTGFHALDGARYLESRAFDERLVGLVAHHSCARVEAEIRDLKDKLSEFAEGPADLTDALTFCDMTVSPEGRPVAVDERIAEVVARYGPDSVVGRFMQRAAPDLRAAAGRVAAHLEVLGVPWDALLTDVRVPAGRVEGVVDAQGHRGVEIEPG